MKYVLLLINLKKEWLNLEICSLMDIDDIALSEYISTYFLRWIIF